MKPCAIGVVAWLVVEGVLAPGALAAPVKKHGAAPTALAKAPSKQPPKGNGAATPAAADGASKAGVLPFVPPVMTRLSNGGVISLDTKGITLGSDDGRTKFRIGGRIQLDGSTADLRPASPDPSPKDVLAVRRAWLETYLTVDKVEGAFQYDFAKTKQPINDAVVAYHVAAPVIVSVGNFKEPFSLDQLISDNNTLFTERSLLDAFAPARDFGATVGVHGERWTAVAGVFGGNINTDLDRNGVAGTARLTYAPILTPDQVLHFGIAGSYRALDEKGTALSFNSLPEDNEFGTSLVNTGKLRGASDVGRIGLEALYQVGSARLKGEYAVTEVGGTQGQATRTFQAGYVEAAWIINGPGRPYELAPDYGSTYAILGGAVVPDSQRLSRGGPGVFELGARYSSINLRDGATQGGAERDVTAGLNWYPDKNIKVMADYVRARADPSAASLTGGRVDSDIFVGRVQFYW